MTVAKRIAVVLAFAGMSVGCAVAEDGGGGATKLALQSFTSRQDETGEEDVGTAEQPVETGCMQACMDAWDRDNAICRGIPDIGQRRQCWEQANQKLAACLKNCPY